jgi:predicted metal-dependent phosphotriesterase family hydrolase
MSTASGSSVQTVLGPVAPDALGRVLHHEHLLSLTPGPWLAGGRPAEGRGARPGGPADHLHEEDQVHRAVDALRGLPALGFGTVVDLSPYGVVGRTEDGANIALLQEISRRTGLHVVTGTAVYLESFSPPWTVRASVEEMTDRFVADATRGIGGTTVRAGVLGEQATGLGQISAHEARCLRAAARAQVRTGLALVTHTTHGTMALEQIELLLEEGVDLARVVIGHMDTHPDTDYVLQVAERGVTVAFDTIGKQVWDFRVEPGPADPPEGEFAKRAYRRSDQVRAERVAALVRAGFVDQVLLSHDLTGEEVYLNPETHGQWGYSYLGTAFAELLAEHGVSPEQLDTMLRVNPARLLAVPSAG